MTDRDLVGQATILFGASTKPRPRSCCGRRFCSRKHPRVYRILRDEIASVLNGKAPRLEQLDRLPYLSAVLKESMRVLPPVAYGLRRTEEIDFDLGGIEVRSGDWVVFCNYLTHVMPQLYPYPKRFLPERWFSIDPSQYEYLPFIAWFCWCIGKPLAMMTMKLSLVTAVQKWRWQVQPDAHIDQRVRVTMRPMGRLADDACAAGWQFSLRNRERQHFADGRNERNDSDAGHRTGNS